MANDTLLIQVVDSASHTVSATFTIPINPAPLTITTASPLPAGKQATAYSQPIRASGGVLPYTWSLVSQTGSNGWIVSSTGFVIGTPTTAETDSLTIKVTDAASNSMQAVFSLTVTTNVIYVPPTITTSSPLPNATVGTAYNFGMSVINGTSPFTWVITSGVLPTGLSFSSSGFFSGTPSATGTVTLGIKVTDAHPTTVGPQNFSLTVNPASVSTNIKWKPGFYVMTRNDGQQAASFAAAASTPKVVGVAGWYGWDGIENNTLGVYSWTQLFNDFLALQVAFPGAFFCPMFNWFAVVYPLTRAEISGGNIGFIQNSGIPKYILQGSAATYGAGPAASPYNGWYPDSWDGSSAYSFVHANLCNANVVNRLIMLYQNFATQIVPNIPGAPQYNGLTVDQHPLFTGIGTSTPTDINMINSLDIPANYTFAAQNTGYQALTAIQQYYKQTVCFLQPGFGGNSFSGSNDPTAQNALLLAMFNAGMGTSATDVTVATPANLSYGQNYFIGNNFNGATGFQPTYVNRMGAMFTSQGHDYGINGGNAPSDASVSTLINTAINTLGCGYYFMESYAQWNFTGAPAFQVQPFWNNYVKGAIAAAPAINTTVPSNLSNIGINGQWYANNSVWNTKIPAGAFAAAMPNSAAVMSAYQAFGGSVTSAFRPTTSTFTTAFVTAAAGNATIRWTFAYQGTWSFPAIPAAGAAGTQLVSNYNALKNAGDTDDHNALFSTDQQVFYALYGGINQGPGGNGPVPILVGAPFPIAGNGWWNNNMFTTVTSGTASGAANSGGVVRTSEWNAGVINHALAGAYPSGLTGGNANSPDFSQDFIYPARASDASNSGNGFLPEGARLQLDPSLSDATLMGLGVTAAMLPICHAMQTYGWYCIDVEGNFPTQIKFQSVDGGAGPYPGTADLPMALMAHMAWIQGPYLVGSSGFGTGVAITGAAGQFSYTKNYGSADGLVHVGDLMTVYATYLYGGSHGTGTITGWASGIGAGSTYKVSVASSSTFTLTNLDNSAIVTTAGTINAYFTTTAPLENVASAEALGLLVSGP